MNTNNHDFNTDESEVKVIVNTYNFNNELITENDIKSILEKYEIENVINNLAIYQKAFIHKSYSKKDPKELGENVVFAEKPEGALELFDYNNETLEFLGDAVLSTVIARYLFERYHGENEGFLTKMRTKLVNGEMLGYLSGKLGFGKHIIISRHIEDKCNGRTNTAILEDALEAFIGAMFLDFNEVDNYNLLDNFYTGIGFQVCEKFIIHVIEDIIDFSDLVLLNTNYKERIKRYFYDTFVINPRYSDVSVSGISNEREYKISIYKFNGNNDNYLTIDHTYLEILSTGIGTSKKKAEQNAAKNALEAFNLL